MIINTIKNLLNENKYVKAKSLYRQAINEPDPVKAEKLFQHSDRLFYQIRNANTNKKKK